MEQNTAADARETIRQITEALAAHARLVRRRFTATFVDRFVPAALRLQKKQFRHYMRLLLPVRCPTCRMFTRQRIGSGKGFPVCLSCGTQFTMTAVRAQCRIDGVRGARN
jgi:ribosomal protein L37AE/L43A